MVRSIGLVAEIGGLNKQSRSKTVITTPTTRDVIEPSRAEFEDFKIGSFMNRA